jgi:hypothetical protein
MRAAFRPTHLRALRVPSRRIVEILNGKRASSAETALRVGRRVIGCPYTATHRSHIFDRRPSSSGVAASFELARNTDRVRTNARGTSCHLFNTHRKSRGKTNSK